MHVPRAMDPTRQNHRIRTPRTLTQTSCSTLAIGLVKAPINHCSAGRVSMEGTNHPKAHAVLAASLRAGGTCTGRMA